MIKKTVSSVFLWVPLLIALHVFSGLETINRASATFDEPVYLASGYYYLKSGKLDFNTEHPPLAKTLAAAPLLFLKPVLPVFGPEWKGPGESTFSDVFLYRNRVDAEKMLNGSRKVVLGLSCLLGFFVFLWAKQLHGAAGGLLALALYVFCPNFTAHGTLVTTDMAETLFYFLSVYVFWYWLEKKPRKLLAVLLSFVTVCAMTSKYTGFLLLPAYAALLAFYRKDISVAGEKLWSHALIFALASVYFMLFFYRLENIGLYFTGFADALRGAASGAPVFLAGMHSDKGWLYYFPAVFFLKTPVPLLLVMLAWLCLSWKTLLNKNTVILLLPAALYFAASCLSGKQLGLRYILPVYPFLIVASAGMLEKLKGKFGSAWYPRAIVAALLLWNALSFAKVHPRHLSYFNEFAGGPSNGYRYLTDSNLDWGQGLKELGEWYGENNLNGIYLSYFGSADPRYYGIKYAPVMMVTGVANRRLRGGDEITFAEGDAVYLAVSATNLQSTFYRRKDVFYWLLKYKPAKALANSIFIYDLGSDARLRDDFRDFRGE